MPETNQEGELSQDALENEVPHPEAPPGSQRSVARFITGDAAISHYVGEHKDDWKIIEKMARILRWFHISFAMFSAVMIVMSFLLPLLYQWSEPEQFLLHRALNGETFGEHAQRLVQHIWVLIIPLLLCGVFLIIFFHHYRMLLPQIPIFIIELKSFPSPMPVSDIRKITKDWISPHFYHWFFQRVAPGIGGNEHKYYGAAAGVLSFAVVTQMIPGAFWLAATSAMLTFASYYLLYLHRESSAKTLSMLLAMPFFLRSLQIRGDMIREINCFENVRFGQCRFDRIFLDLHMACLFIHFAVFLHIFTEATHSGIVPDIIFVTYLLFFVGIHGNTFVFLQSILAKQRAAFKMSKAAIFLFTYIYNQIFFAVIWTLLIVFFENNLFGGEMSYRLNEMMGTSNMTAQPLQMQQ
jgi:hypothetical protein